MRPATSRSLPCVWSKTRSPPSSVERSPIATYADPPSVRMASATAPVLGFIPAVHNHGCSFASQHTRNRLAGPRGGARYESAAQFEVRLQFSCSLLLWTPRVGAKECVDKTAKSGQIMPEIGIIGLRSLRSPGNGPAARGGARFRGSGLVTQEYQL